MKHLRTFASGQRLAHLPRQLVDREVLPPILEKFVSAELWPESRIVREVQEVVVGECYGRQLFEKLSCEWAVKVFEFHPRAAAARGGLESA